MIAQLTALLPVWGPWLVGAMAFLSCMMVPVPTSAVLVAAGALTGTGHLVRTLALARAAQATRRRSCWRAGCGRG